MRRKRIRSSPNHHMLVGGGGGGAGFFCCHFNGLPSCIKSYLFQKRIVFAANNSLCCECHVAPTIIWSGIVG
jgi:hypothetical protein